MPLESLRVTTVFASGYNGSTVNCKVWRVPLWSYTGIQTVTYYKSSSARLEVATRPSGGDTWTIQDSTFTGNNASDSHCVTVCAMDTGGIRHHWWGNHADAVKYSLGTNGSDVTVDANDAPMTTGSTLEDSFTYPAPITLDNDDLMLLYRDGGSGNGQLVQKIWTPGGAAGDWTEQPLIAAEGESPYINGMLRRNPATGRVHLTWTYAQSFNTQTYYNRYYMRTDDNGATWQSFDGTTLTLPVTHSQANSKCLIWTQGTNTGVSNVGALSYDADDNPISVITYDGRLDYNSQFYAVHRSGGAWVSTLICEAGAFSYYNLDIVANPESITNPGRFSSPILLPHRGKQYLIFGCPERCLAQAEPDGLWCAIASDSALTSWSEVTKFCDHAIGGASPSYDEQLFADTGRLSMFFQEAYESAGAFTLDGWTGNTNNTPTAISVVDFAPLHELTDSIVMDTLTPFARSVMVEQFRDVGSYVPTATHTAHLYEAGAEVSGGGYAADTIDNDGTTYEVAGRVITVAIALAFGTSSGSWGSPDEIRIKDSDGNTLASFEIPASADYDPATDTIDSGRIVSLPADLLTVTASAGALVDGEVADVLAWLFGDAVHTPHTSTWGVYGTNASTPIGSRVEMVQADTWGAASDGVSESIDDVTIADQPTATHWIEYDIAVGGNIVSAQAIDATFPSGTIQAGFLVTAFT